MYRRFFTAHRHLRPREVEWFIQVDCHDGLAPIAERDGRLIAVARYDLLDGTDAAEVAFVVSDAEQGHAQQARHLAAN